MNLTAGAGQTAKRIVERLVKEGFTAYFAGGCVRDFLMKEDPKDFDVATTAKPEVVERLFSKTVPVGKQFGVVLVIEDEKHFEVATFRREGEYLDGRHPSSVTFCAPEEDAKRRDFTVNSLFYDPLKEELIDFVGGREDLKKRLIRAIGNPLTRFSEDKLRLLRAVRFTSSLGFKVEANTWEAIRKMADQINQVSPERVRDEVVKILTRPGARRGLELLSESGLLKVVLPEIDGMKGVQQPPDFHPEGDVFIHTGMLLERLKSPSAVLALAALLHDVGKPPTYQIRKGRITFYEHAPLGAKMTRDIMKRLRFSNQEVDAVAECVANHMKFADVRKMRAGKLKQFVVRPTFETELELHRIDCEASHGMLDNYFFLKEKLKEYEKEDLKPKPLINGHDLMELGLKAGPSMKPILEGAYELQLEGDLKSRQEALAWAKKKITQLGKSLR